MHIINTEKATRFERILCFFELNMDINFKIYSFLRKYERQCFLFPFRVNFQKSVCVCTFPIIRKFRIKKKKKRIRLINIL